MRKGGCWIFLSHSHHDIEKVRLVRNEFERLGHNPLAFHLKCLSTDTEEGRHELDSLIKREIDAREWFVFCDSPKAAKSRYVQMEQAYIINSGKDKVWTIDMTTDVASILHSVRKICADIEVFISYANCDRDKAQPLINALVRKDFSVWTPEDTSDECTDAIARCAYEGIYIIVITQETVNSGFMEGELAFATSQGACIVPIIIGNPKLPEDIRNWIGHYHQMPAKPTEADFGWVVDILDDIVKKKISNTAP